ncbi:MAG: helicase-related protein [Gemmatimonadaceae bacterium]
MGKNRAHEDRIEVPPAETRSAIAAAMQASHGHARLGTVELEPHQVEAVSRLRDAITEFGGALDCDPVGTGKTFTALALAGSYKTVLVVAPAVLRTMWQHASERAGISVDFVSHEALSRSAAPRRPPDFVIVDEAHHARNPATRRYRSLASIMSGAEAVLLTATPVHNRRGDLIALFSLFLGNRAAALSEAEIGRITVRRDGTWVRASVGIPRIAAVEWEEPPDDESVPLGIFAIPPPLPVRDGGDGGALVNNSLMRQWASSDAALRGGLIRRRQRAIAMLSALESGAWPTRAELAAWTLAEDSVQLGFAELLAAPTPAPGGLLKAVRAHYDGVCRMLEALKTPSDRDLAMAETIRRIRESHRGIRIVAFSQYQDTVSAMFRALARYGHVAALSGSGGSVSGGAITRQDVLARFAPESTGISQSAHARDVSLLLTTDLLSEGVNLQDAAVVIHLDLPWTPARIEQRIGRIARMGSRHRIVHAYAFRPPSSAERIVRIRRILSLKERESEATRDSPRFVETLRTRIGAWLTPAGITVCTIASAVVAPRPGFLALCVTDRSLQLLGSLDDVMTDDPELLCTCASFAEGLPAPLDRLALENAVCAIESHLAVAGALAGATSRNPSDATYRILRRIASIVGRAKSVDRARITAVAHDAREKLLGRHGAHLENELARIASAPMADDEFLESLASGQGTPPESRRARPGVHIPAIILFIPPAASAASAPVPAGRT